MPELGKHAESVLSAYAVSIALLVGLIAISLWRADRVKRALKAVEEKAKRDG